MTLELTIIRTRTDTYIGSTTVTDGIVHLMHAARIPDAARPPADLALTYFGEKVGRRLCAYDIPLTSIEEIRAEPLLAPLIDSYAALSKAANKGVAGRVTMRRLRKMLGGAV